MPDTPSLLALQDLDSTNDRLREKRAGLPERAELEASLQLAAELDRIHSMLLERRAELGRAEEVLGAEVGTLAKKSKEEEDVLYSGKVKVSKELETLQEEIRLLREKQSALEADEMELLESIDSVDGEIESNREARRVEAARAEALEKAIACAESEIDRELAKLAVERPPLVGGIPGPMLADYDRLREQPRLRGRAAAPLPDGTCGACRIKLPVMEYSQMKAEPPDAVLHCPQCRRILVRV